MDHVPRPLSEDTPLDVERRWLALMREKGAAWRLEKTFELTRFVREAALAAFARARPAATRDERDEWLVRQCYGEETADRFVAWRDRRARRAGA